MMKSCQFRQARVQADVRINGNLERGEVENSEEEEEEDHDDNKPVDEIPINSVYMEMRAARIERNRSVIERLELNK